MIGIDEAGRGALVGPLVIAGLLLDREVKGVKDSKQLSKKQREKLFPVLLTFPHHYEVIHPRRIDAASNLNWLEAEVIRKIIRHLPRDEVVVDCPSTNIRDFSRMVGARCEHHADENYQAVGGASIIAKVVRDREIEKIKMQVGYDFGSGYPSDPKTIAFLKKFREHDVFRKSWKTYKRR